MADYENRQIPEGINVSPTHPLKDFALLLGGVSALVVAAVVMLALLAGYLVRYVPFAQEERLVSAIDVGRFTSAHTPESERKERYLQALADQLAGTMALPPGMRITVHYSSDKTVNAMAFLGGNIVVFQGLIDTLSNENALTMVLAHEIAHVRHRHPIIAMGRGFTVILALSTLSGVGDGLIQDWIGSMGLLPVLAFSRTQESEADIDALLAVHERYGHVDGAVDFFEAVAALPDAATQPEIFNSHPGHQERIARIRAFAARHPAPAGEALVPLPDYLK